MSIGLMRVWRDRSRLITVPWQTIMIFEHRSRRLLIQQRLKSLNPLVCRFCSVGQFAGVREESVDGFMKLLEVCQKRFTVVVVFFEVRKPVWSHSQIFPQ